MIKAQKVTRSLYLRKVASSEMFKEATYIMRSVPGDLAQQMQDLYAGKRAGFLRSDVTGARIYHGRTAANHYLPKRMAGYEENKVKADYHSFIIDKMEEVETVDEAKQVQRKAQTDFGLNAKLAKARQEHAQWKQKNHSEMEAGGRAAQNAGRTGFQDAKNRGKP